MTKKRNPRIGSSLDDFLEEEGILEELQIQAVKDVVARQLEEAMKKKRMSKVGLAKLLRDIQDGLESGSSGKLNIDAIKRRGRKCLDATKANQDRE
jgi:antitoxin HicB